MTNKPKIIMIGRHGKAPQKPEGGSFDTLLPEAVPELYKQGIHLQEYGFQPADASLRHTSSKRTRMSGEAVLAGIFGYTQPETVEDIAQSDLTDVQTIEDTRLNLRKPVHSNMAVYKAQGAGPQVDFGIQNPNVDMYEGEPIMPYATLRADTRASIMDAVQDPRDLGLMVTHASMTEPSLITLVNSGRSTPVERIADVGGTFGMAEFAELKIEEDGGIYKATLHYKDQDFKVDLDNI
jgi:hypothetical protein